MGSQKNIKLLEEIRKWNTEQLINVLELNGLGECCEAIRKKDIDGDSFLNLNETQLVFWKNILTNVQVKRLWSCIQQAKDSPANFIPQNTPSKQTNADKVNPLVSQRLSNLHGQQNNSSAISRRPEISENKPKLKPPPPSRKVNYSRKIDNAQCPITKRTEILQEQKNNPSQTSSKPMMPSKPTNLSNSKKIQRSFSGASESTLINNTVKTGKVKSAIADKLENLFGQQNNSPVASIEPEVSTPSPNLNIKNVPVPPRPNTLGTKSTTNETVGNLESQAHKFHPEEEDLAHYENKDPISFLHSNSYKNTPPPRPNALSINKEKSMSSATMENISNPHDKPAPDEIDQVQYENNLEQTKQNLAPQSPAKNISNIGKFKSPISEKLENLFSQQNNPAVISQEYKVPETSENFPEQDFSLSEDDEWDSSDNESPPSPLNDYHFQTNTPPTPPRPSNAFPPKPSIYTKRPPVPIPPAPKDISTRPPIPIPQESISFSTPSIPLPQIPSSNFSKPSLLPSSSGSFTEPPLTEEENMYEAEPSKEEENVYEVEPMMEEDNKSFHSEPSSPIYKVPPPNPKPVKREIPKPSVASRPLPLPPPDETPFPLPPNVVPIKRITRPPAPPDLPRPPAFLPPTDIPRIPDTHDSDVDYDEVDESKPDYKKQPWFQDIERKQAITFLYCRPNGSFIVRPSRKIEIECAFSVIYDRKVYNLPVKKEKGILYFGKNTFHTVSEIVERFLEHPLVLNGPNNEDIYVNLRL